MRVTTQIPEETIFSNELCRFFYWLHAKAIISVTKVWLEWRSLSSIGSHWDDTHLLLPTTGCTWFCLRCYLSLLDLAMILSWLDTHRSSAFHCTNMLSLLFRPLHPYLQVSNWFVLPYWITHGKRFSLHPRLNSVIMSSLDTIILLSKSICLFYCIMIRFSFTPCVCSDYNSKQWQEMPNRSWVFGSFPRADQIRKPLKVVDMPDAQTAEFAGRYTDTWSPALSSTHAEFPALSVNAGPCGLSLYASTMAWPFFFRRNPVGNWTEEWYEKEK